MWAKATCVSGPTDRTARPRSRELGLLDGLRSPFHPVRGMELAPARGEMVIDSEWRCMGQTARFQEPLRWLAMIDEGFVED